jgi:alkaline phosphatase D
MAETQRPEPTVPSPPSAVGRRGFLVGATGAAALLATQRIPGAWATPGAWPDDPFSLGVASGDPTATGVVLWTRLAPRPLDPGGGMPARAVPVDWEVATGPRLRDVVRRGRVVASPALGHAVHVEVDGLDPGRHYGYRFRATGHLSRVGRTKTCADPRRPLGRLALAFVSCQNFEKGATTPPTATWPRRIWTWSCTWATTSTRTPPQGRPAPPARRRRADRPGRLPGPPRPLQDRP